MRKPVTLCSDTLSSVSMKEKDSQMEKFLERDGVSPGELVIQNIMNYSRALSVIRMKDGYINRVMN